MKKFMKKVMAVGLTAVFLFSMAACAGSGDSDTSETSSQETSGESTEAAGTETDSSELEATIAEADGTSEGDTIRVGLFDSLQRKYGCIGRIY